MAGFTHCALAIAVLLVAAHAGSISPVQKVISMIDDFAGKVQHDLNTASKQFEQDAKFCDDEVVAKDYAIKDTNEQIESLTASIEDSKAKINEYSANIQDASGRISDTEGEVYKATAQREKAHKEFLVKEKEMLATHSELVVAEKTLEKQMALMQGTPESKKRLNKEAGAAVSALSQIVEAEFVSSAQKEKVRAFLQARADSEDSLTLSSKNDGNDGIIETIHGVDDKAEETLSDVRKAEMQSNHEFMMLKQGLESQIKSTQQELNENTHAKQATTEALAQAEKDLGIAQRALAADTEYLADHKRECQEKARTWEAEHKDGEAELKALSAAKDILTQKFSLVSTKQTLVSKIHRQADADDAKTKALQVIEQLGRKFKSTALVSLAYSAAADPFGKVRDMIEDMIAKLQHEAAEEATQKAFCDEETGKSEKSKAEKMGKLEKTNARVEQAEAGIAKLSDQITTLSTELAEIDSAVKAATTLRQQENSAFRVAEKDFSESQDACAQAIEVLREYYEGAGAALVQVGSKSSRDGSGIIGLLEVAESDFAKLLSDARTSEDAAASDFKKMTQENKLSKATKEAERKGKESEVKSLQTALSNGNEDKEGITTELDAVLAYLAELKPQCETKAPSYAEKKAKREAEIDGLKNALEILSDSA